jgi:flagellar biosynthesis/type III secretory pathway protein FliH
MTQLGWFQNERNAHNKMTPKEREEWRAKERAEIEATKVRLSERYGVKRDEKFEKAWNLAWDYGHSSGFMEVEMYFQDLAELIKP